MDRPSSSPRRELAVILALTSLGAGLRLWDAGRLGLEHFDEGIYAAAGSWAFARRGLAALDPRVIAYAPPGVPILVGLAYLTLGPSDLSAIAVGLVTGILTVPLAAWVGWRTFGAGAGAATAALAAASGPHVAFSRMALTDVPFLLAWLACMGLGGRFLDRPRFGRAVALGLAVGWAQNLKYNGWLAGVVVALAAGLGLAVRRGDRRSEAVRTIGFGLIAALVAALAYGPWFWFVERQVGYRSLLAHHRGYLGGLSSWWPHWRSQMAQAIALSGGVVWVMSAWATAWIGAAIAVGAPTPIGRGAVRPVARFGVGLLAGMAALAVLPNLSWWAGLTWSAWLVRHGRPAVRMLGIWWMVLSILTPFYHPYARLWLPLHAAGWLVVGGLIVELGPMRWPVPTSETVATIEGRGGRPRLGIGPIVGAALVLALVDRFGANPRARPLPDLLRPSGSIQRALVAAESLINHRNHRHGREGIVRTWVRPSVSFYLVGRVAIAPQEGLDQLLRHGQPGDWALVDEVLLRQEGEIARARLLAGWELVAEWPVPLSPPTLLDVDPGAAYGGSPAESSALLLLRRKPTGAGP